MQNTTPSLTISDTHRIVGPQARAKSAEFQTALLFAQEYGILAASLEDRPFVPVGTVVLDGAPRDMKAIFRKWDEGTGSRQQGEKVVGLSAALEALGL